MPRLIGESLSKVLFEESFILGNSFRAPETQPGWMTTTDGKPP